MTDRDAESFFGLGPEATPADLKPLRLPPGGINEALGWMAQHLGACADAPMREREPTELDALRAEVERLRRVAEAARALAVVAGAYRLRGGEPLSPDTTLSVGHWGHTPIGVQFFAQVQFKLADFQALEAAYAAAEAKP